VTGTVGPADVEDAARSIAGSVERTPSARSHVLSELLGTDVIVKFENLQFTSSFKERGALNRLLRLDADERSRGVVAMSAGNHPRVVPRHAARLGIDAVIVMPTNTPFTKVVRTRDLGARVLQLGEDLAGAATEAARIAHAEGRVMVPPYDHPAIVAGQGTVALEMLDDHPDIDTLVVPAGGGGLLGGMAVMARHRRPDIRIHGVQSERWPALANAVHGSQLPVGGPTIAEGIAVPVPSELTIGLVRDNADEVLLVTEEAIEAGINLLLDIEKVVTEGAGAAGIAALQEHPGRFAGRTVGVVLTGANIDSRLLASVIMRGLVRAGRLARLQVQVADIPGSLARVTAVVSAAGANVVEVAHQRMFLDVPARSAELELVVETFDHDHRERLLAALAGAGFQVQLADPLNRTGG
jgi:threonine dehydratase